MKINYNDYYEDSDEEVGFQKMKKRVRFAKEKTRKPQEEKIKNSRREKEKERRRLEDMSNNMDDYD